MVSITENVFLFIGGSANFWLIFNLAIRPVLWSTTNTFLGCLLSINFLYIFVEICILGNINEPNEQVMVDEFVEALDYLFLDHHKSIICSAQHLANFIFAFSSLVVLLGTIFIRMMMIKHAGNIWTSRFIRKSHQAHLRIIGLLVAILIVTLITNTIINLVLFPLFPFENFPVKSCRGVLISYTTEEQQQIFRAWLIRVVSLVLMLIAVVVSHVRIILFRRYHSLSYFSKHRQNIATLDQTLAAAYLKIVLAVVQNMNFIPIFANYGHVIDHGIFMKLANYVNSIVVPCYWMFSTKKNFKDFWSKETVFLKELHPLSTVAPRKTFGEQGTSPVLVPRRPEYQETSFTN